MNKKVFMFFVAAMFILGQGIASFAQHKHEGMDMTTPQNTPQEPPTSQEAIQAVDIGNKICPISGEKVEGPTKATFVYEGKIYNFCCPECIDEFKKDPKKYIKIIEEEKAREKAKQ